MEKKTISPWLMNHFSNKTPSSLQTFIALAWNSLATLGQNRLASSHNLSHPQFLMRSLISRNSPSFKSKPISLIKSLFSISSYLFLCARLLNLEGSNSQVEEDSPCCLLERLLDTVVSKNSTLNTHKNQNIFTINTTRGNPKKYKNNLKFFKYNWRDGNLPRRLKILLKQCASTLKISPKSCSRRQLMGRRVVKKMEKLEGK